METKQKALVGATVAGAAAGAALAFKFADTDSKLTKVADFDHQVTGISVTADGRIFVRSTTR